MLGLEGLEQVSRGGVSLEGDCSRRAGREIGRQDGRRRKV